MPVHLAPKLEDSMQEKIKYCVEQLGLSEPRILMNKIKINSLIVIDGYPMHISGRQNDRLKTKNAVQLCFPQGDLLYLKKIENYVKRNIERKDKKNNLNITDFEGITKEDNLRIYDILLEKHKNKIYSNRPGNQIKCLMKGRNIFEELTVEEQCLQISEIFYLFQCKPISANLTYIKGSGKSGIMTIGKDISNFNSAKLINQSPTGLFQREIDLLKL